MQIRAGQPMTPAMFERKRKGAVSMSSLAPVARTTRTRRLVTFAFVMGSLMTVTACSRTRTESLGRGTVYITIFQPNGKLSYDQATFEIQLSQSSVRQIHGHQFQTDVGPKSPSRSVGAVESPNKMYVASSTVDLPRFVGYPRHAFFVRNIRTGATVFRSKFSYEEIDSIAWSSESDAVAVLTSSSHYSVNPKNWLAALGGHPIPIEHYRLEIIDLSSHSNRGVNIPYESSASFGELTTWSQM